MLKLAAIFSGFTGVEALRYHLLAQTTDPLSGGGGWFGAGLLGLILMWLLLRHLPDKDRQLAQFITEKDRHIKELAEKYEAAIKVVTESFHSDVKTERDLSMGRYREVMAVLDRVNATGREAIHAVRNLHSSINIRQVMADAFQSTEVAAWTKHLDGTLISWNGAAERMFGWSQGEVVGRSIYDVIIPPDRREEEADILRRIAKGETVEAYKTERMSKSGRRIPIRVVTSPIRNQNGLVIGASSLSRPLAEVAENELS